MSKSAQSDEIDELVSSVRDFVSHKEPKKPRTATGADRLVLTDEQRINEEPDAQEPVNADETGPDAASNVHHLAPAKPNGSPHLEATIAELEVAVATQSDDWEAEEGEAFEGGAWADSAFQGAETDSDADIVSAEPDAPAEDRKGVPSLLEASENPSANPINEAALRALVVDIVHAELSGELGERITRNVRKLVRREINRVLTSREVSQD